MTYKFNLLKRQTKPLLIGLAGLVMAGVSIYVAYASLNRKSTTPTDSDAASAACLLNLTIRPPGTQVTPPPSGCVSFGIDEHSTQNLSNVVKFDNSLTVTTKLGSTSGIYNVESMDNHPNGTLYAIANSTHKLYTVNKSTGGFTAVATLSVQRNFSDMAFKPNGTLYAWNKGNGLYQINLSTGAATQVLTSSLSDVEGIAWDSTGSLLYLSRTPAGTSSYQLWRYNPADTNVSTRLTQFGTLPKDTDTLDWAPSTYRGGHLMGAYETSSGVSFYSYNVATRSVVSTAVSSTQYKNIDAMAICTTP